MASPGLAWLRAPAGQQAESQARAHKVPAARARQGIIRGVAADRRECDSYPFVEAFSEHFTTAVHDEPGKSDTVCARSHEMSVIGSHPGLHECRNLPIGHQSARGGATFSLSHHVQHNAEHSSALTLPVLCDVQVSRQNSSASAGVPVAGPGNLTNGT